MRIAILGTRGIPAHYGGFETFAEEISTRLAQRGHRVTVYCREQYEQPKYRGVNLVYLATLRHKYFDTIYHTAISTFHLLFHRQDVALYCNAANAIFTPWPRLLGIPVALNVDGLERNRKKWNRLAKLWYVVSEFLATIFPSAIITDALAIEEYYQSRYGKGSHFIAYGADQGQVTSTAVLEELGLQPHCYFLYVSRMEPENNGLLVRQAFEKTTCALRLALVGDAPYAPDYIRQVRETSDPRIVMPGAIYGSGYRELQSHSFAYIHATEVGGTHPALIEAMGRGALVLYLNTIENEEVAGGVGLPFEPATLTQVMEQALAMPEEDRRRLRALAYQRVQDRYSWDSVTDKYEQLLSGLLGQRTTSKG